MRLLHSMFYTANIEGTLTFYTNGLGMRLLRRLDYHDEAFSRYFIGYVEEEDGAVVEFTHMWNGPPPEQPGDLFGHIGIEVLSIDESYQRALQWGAVGEKAPHKPRTTWLAFVRDPNGIQIEFVQKKNNQPPASRN